MGLNGHREKTWTAATGAHWPRDFLPKDIPNARIFCWGYDANTHGDRISCQYLYDHAKSLVSDLCLKRRLTNTTRRPIIFVSHSLGGIIVKSALIHSDAARKGALEEHRSIKTSTYGIIFMGTPHQGGSGVQLGKLLVNVASIFVAADDRLMKHLERDSEWLQQQLGQYGPISGEFVTKFAYEEYKTPTVLGHSIMVVPRASAVVPGAADAEPIVIHADHINMTKFVSKEDNGYKTISGHLQIMSQSASNVIASRWEEESRVNAARTNPEESFSVGFSLADFPENAHFVARQNELAEMHEILSGNDRRQSLVLYGLGGIGKTQLAVAYARLHKAEYSAILWLNIKDEDSLKQSFARAARRILRENPLPSSLDAVAEDNNLDKVVDAVKRWLDHSKNTRWLVVYDNYDNPKLPGVTDHAAVDIRRFLPEADHGSIIITTRISQVKFGHSIHVTKLADVRDSLQILFDTSRRNDTMDNAAATELVTKLDGLPLAIATAGAYLDQVSTSFADYLRLYEASWLRLQQTSPALSSYEDRALYSTWQLSFDHIQRQNELSAKLLQLWAYFDNQDLWLELLQEGRLNGPEWLSQLTQDEISFNQAVRVLCDHGLAEADKSSAESGPESKGYSMHSCVHSWTVYVLNQRWDAETAGLAVKCVGWHVQDIESHESWIVQRRLNRHAARCWSFVVNCKVSVEHTLTLDAVNNLSRLYWNQDKLADAEKMCKWALQGYEKTLGVEHTSTLDTVNYLAILYRRQDKLVDAKKMCERALQGYEKTLGVEHMSTLQVVNNLAIIYTQQGKLADAEKIYQRALQGYEKVLGAEHTSTLQTVNNLGLLYWNQGKPADAEKMYRRALQGYEKVLGAEHTSTLQTVNNFGLLYWNQNKLADAEKMYRRALQGYEKALGAEHTSTLQTVNNLAILYKNQGKLADAEKMYQRALQGYEKALGAEHTSILQVVNNLATLYMEQGKLADAEKMYQRALQGYEKALGVEHTSTLEIVNNLAILYMDQCKLAEAEKMYRRALQGYEKALGAEHTSTLQVVNNSASLYMDQGKLAEAEKMYQRALQGYEKALGIDNIATYIPALNTIWGLGSLFERQADLAKARIMYSKALAGYEKVYGPDHLRSRSLQESLRALGARERVMP